MKSFNSFQLVSLFATTPFMLSWVREQTFRGANIAFGVGSIVYFVMFIMMCVMVRSSVDKFDF